MFSDFMRTASDAAKELGEGAEIAALCLFAAPALWFVLSFLVALFRRRAACPARNSFYLASDIFLIAFCAFGILWQGEDLVGVLSVCAFMLAGKAVCLALGCLYVPLSREKKQKKCRRAERAKKYLEEAAEENDFSRSGKPKKVCCFAEEASEPPAPSFSAERAAPPPAPNDVRLDYVFSVAERLRSLPLGAGDRLEAEKMNELLSVYKNKGTLSPKESETLNDILASLLKMMAKYDI